jgi:hypothetical protein
MKKPERIYKGQEKLTPEQEEYAQQFAQERINSMLSCTAIDEHEAEHHLQGAYRVAGLPAPHFLWFDSPIAFIVAHFPQVRAPVGDPVWAQVRDQVGAQVGAPVWAQVWAQVGAPVWAQVRAQVGDPVWAQVRAQVRAPVWAQVRAQVGDPVWAPVGDPVWASTLAYYDANWLAFYQFFHEVFADNDLIHLALFNEMVSGYRLGSKEAWLVRKPIRLERDAQGRLHSESGKCMEYRDGWGFYAWHGVRCPEKIILHPEQLTKDDWMHEENLEIRRVIQERMGDRFVVILDGKIIDKGVRGTLYEVDVTPDPERIAMYLHVKDSSTDREYYLRVPPTVKTAQEACAWTFGLSEEAYQPVQEA